MKLETRLNDMNILKWDSVESQATEFSKLERRIDHFVLCPIALHGCLEPGILLPAGNVEAAVLLDLRPERS